MKFWRSFRAWLGGIRGSEALKPPNGRLREFVYLDDVSVYSILASRKGAIDDVFTETQTASLSSDVGTSLGVGFPGTQAKIGSRLQTAQGQGSQVVRKATIQTSFKQLYELESPSLAFRPADNDQMPSVKTVSDLAALLNSRDKGNWLIDPANIHRGQLLEVEVKLQADPIFRIASVMTTMHDLIGDNKLLFENTVNLQQLRQIGEMSQMLEDLMVGLVPIRALLVDYVSVPIGDRDVLVHQDLLNQIPTQDCLETSPVSLVGVAEHNLFWKDIRRVLFGDGQYTVFCRLATAGLSNRWRPVKLADVLGDLVPHFDELISQASEQASIAMRTAADQSLSGTDPGNSVSEKVIDEYSGLLVQHHQGTQSPDIKALIPANDDWLGSVDDRRRVLTQVTDHIESALGVTTSGDVAYNLRLEAMRRTGVETTLPTPTLTAPVQPVRASTGNEEKFLDAEIIAIYW